MMRPLRLAMAVMLVGCVLASETVMFQGEPVSKGAYDKYMAAYSRYADLYQKHYGQMPADAIPIDEVHPESLVQTEVQTEAGAHSQSQAHAKAGSSKLQMENWWEERQGSWADRKDRVRDIQLERAGKQAVSDKYQFSLGTNGFPLLDILPYENGRGFTIVSRGGGGVPRYVHKMLHNPRVRHYIKHMVRKLMRAKYNYVPEEFHARMTDGEPAVPGYPITTGSEYIPRKTDFFRKGWSSAVDDRDLNIDNEDDDWEYGDKDTPTPYVGLPNSRMKDVDKHNPGMKWSNSGGNV